MKQNTEIKQNTMMTLMFKGITKRKSHDPIQRLVLILPVEKRDTDLAQKGIASGHPSTS